MMLPIALVAALLAQDPSASPTEAASPHRAPVVAEAAVDRTLRRDQVVLVGGEVLEGHIVLERGTYLELELAPGATVGFRLAQVAEIRRGAGSETIALRPAFAPRDEWFTLHDGTGTVVGTLHALVQADGSDGAKLVEEWEFDQDGRTYQITAMESVDASLAPRTCYYRERVLQDTSTGSPLDPMAKSLRVRGERIVEGVVVGDELVVDRIAGGERSQRRIPFARPASFPVLARELQRTTLRAPVEIPVFDPAVEELGTVRYEAPRLRRARFEEAAVEVEEFVVRTAEGQNATWVESVRGTLRREIAGPGLVAMRVEDGSAKDLVGTRSSSSPFVAEALRRFGLWVPNPVWKVEGSRPGAVALSAPAHGASMSLSRLDGLDPTASLDTAVAAVERWSKLQTPSLEVFARATCTVRGESAVRLDTRGGSARSEVRAVAVVVASEHGFLVLRASAPALVFDELAADFAAAAARLELSTAAVAALDGKPAEPVREGEAEAVPQAEPPVESGSPASPLPRLQKGRVRVPMQIGSSR